MSKSKRARPRKAQAASKVRSKATGRKSVADRKGGDSKQDHVLGLLRRPSGATIENVTQATGWQRTPCGDSLPAWCARSWV